MSEPAREFTYYGDADAMYVGFRTNFGGRLQQYEAGNGIIFDLVDGEVVGMEVLSASRSVFAAMVPQATGGLRIKRVSASLSPPSTNEEGDTDG